MTPARWVQLKEIFHTAMELQPVERRAFLLERCGGDAEMLRELERLMESHDEAGDFIEQPALAPASEILPTDASSVWAGQKIGQYRVEREIGRGGMGLVLLGVRDDDQFKKSVAIKILRRGMDTEDILRRFRNERQILASLEHPNIARLFDGGMTEDGLPYFVMEYIEGEPLDKYADEQMLSIKQRLELFRKVCAAVQYAHQNLVVHRDLKPSNIIITSQGEPKLLDFGIAKVLNPDLSAREPEWTRTEMRVLTPDYASPEQVRGEKLTTRSDIYSLGVVLYELLTGHRPYHATETAPHELARVICEQEPTKPSVAVETVEVVKRGDGDSTRLPSITPESVSHARDTQPDKLRHLLSGDLDNIVLMALRKEAQRRYESAEQLSTDIQRHLDGLPVIARKDTFAYRASKFIGRNKVGVTAAAMIVLAVLVGLMVSIQQTRAARRERAKAEAVSNFLQTMLLASSPESVFRLRKNDPTVRDILDDASKRLDAGDLSDQPEVKAELQRIIGVSYLSQGEYDLAERNLKSALEIETKIYGEDHLETLKTTVRLAEVLLTKGDNVWADNFYRRNLPILRAEVKRGTLDAEYLISALEFYALLRRAQGDSKEAEALLREELALYSQVPPGVKNSFGISSAVDKDVTESTLALTLADQGKFDEAEKIDRAKIASIRQQPNGEISGFALSTNLTGLGNILMAKGELAEAEENLREAEALYRKQFDRDYLPLGDNLRIQAQTLYLDHRYAEAEAKISECLEIYRKNTGPAYINYATAVMIQGMIYEQTGRTEEAEKLLREAVQLRSQYSPQGHFMRAVAEGELGQFLSTHKRFDEAEPLLLSSYESLKNSQAPNSPRVRTAHEHLVALYENWGRLDTAAEYRSKL